MLKGEKRRSCKYCEICLCLLNKEEVEVEVCGSSQSL